MTYDNLKFLAMLLAEVALIIAAMQYQSFYIAAIAWLGGAVVWDAWVFKRK